MAKYNDIVSKFREIARDVLRLEAVARFRSDILRLNIFLDNKETQKKNVAKAIAVREYKISKLDPADPEAEEKKKDLEEDIKYLNKDVEDLNKDIEYFKKEISTTEEKIAKVESGETKMDKEKLDALVHAYNMEYGTKRAVKETVYAPAAPTEGNAVENNG